MKKMFSIFKRLIQKVLNIFPSYRRLREIESELSCNSHKLEKISSELATLANEKSLAIQNVSNKLIEQIEANQILEKEVRRFKPQAYSTNLNLLGEIVSIPNQHTSKTVKYNLTIWEYFDKLKEVLIKTDILLDIGCGIRPQNFFEPRIHICLEPYQEYRDVVKPFFPNKNSSFIFLKTDAISGIKLLDDNSVDSIFMIDLIEHLDKKDGLELLKEADRVARKQIFVLTPLGFYPQHYEVSRKLDNWGLTGTKLQEHKSGWIPEDFGKGWDFHICIDAHEADDPKEKAAGKRYSALGAIKTKSFSGFKVQNNTPEIVKEIFNSNK